VIIDINTVVFHFDDFNYGRGTATIFFNDCNFDLILLGEVSSTSS